jgi:23S rRNA (cytosine1962-C5)-methyltransferase
VEVVAELEELLERARERRVELVARLADEGTDCWRLFHGVAEGRPGLTIDRYGPLVLVQTFRAPLADGELERIETALRGASEVPLRLAWNHRGPAEHPGRPDEIEVVARERGVPFLVRARHRGQDPWLFLDLRAARRRLAALAPGKSVLNLFAYTCGAGTVAAAAGASEVWNVDVSASALAVGRRNAENAGVSPDRVRFVQEDCLPILWQLAGAPVKGRGSARPYVRVERRPFDVVFLDPPAWSRGPFGAVDVARDYAGLFKPAVRALAPGGRVIATNHAAEVALADWTRGLERCAEKAGRPLVELETFGPDADFPAFDGRPPLKVAVGRVV